jgi:hypothetical protein
MLMSRLLILTFDIYNLSLQDENTVLRILTIFEDFYRWITLRSIGNTRYFPPAYYI